MASGPIIVTALFDPADFAWLDGLRRAHYPADRNRVPAHLTLFHHLPPSLEGELHRRLRAEADASHPPPAQIAGLLKLDRGVAFRIDSLELEELRARLADAFAAMLVPQDASPWRPHVTIQNKAAPDVAVKLHAQLAETFRPRTLGISGLATWRYVDGRWDSLKRAAFNRSGRYRRK